jgi:hypothetical protein
VCVCVKARGNERKRISHLVEREIQARSSTTGGFNK